MISCTNSRSYCGYPEEHVDPSEEHCPNSMRSLETKASKLTSQPGLGQFIAGRQKLKRFLKGQPSEMSFVNAAISEQDQNYSSLEQSRQSKSQRRQDSHWKSKSQFLTVQVQKWRDRCKQLQIQVRLYRENNLNLELKLIQLQDKSKHDFNYSQFLGQNDRLKAEIRGLESQISLKNDQLNFYKRQVALPAYTGNRFNQGLQQKLKESQKEILNQRSRVNQMAEEAEWSFQEMLKQYESVKQCAYGRNQFMDRRELIEVPGLVQFEITDLASLDEWRKLNKELEANKQFKNQEPKQEVVKKPVAGYSGNKQPEKRVRRQTVTTIQLIDQGQIKEAKVELNMRPSQRPSKEAMVQKLLKKFSYSSFKKDLGEINEENIREKLEDLQGQKKHLQESMRGIRVGSRKQEEEERARLKVIDRLYNLYLDKLSMKQHIELQHKVIMQIASELIDYQTVISSKVSEIEKISKGMPTENDKLNQLELQNQKLRAQRDREIQLKRQIEQHIAKNQKNFQSLFNDALQAKSIIHDQLKRVVHGRAQHSKESSTQRKFDKDAKADYWSGKKQNKFSLRNVKL